MLPISKHLRDVIFGGNWTSVNLRDTVADITWEEATKKQYSFNTILALVYHMNYYVEAAFSVLNGQELTAKDKFSFDHPPVNSESDWRIFLDKVFQNAEELAQKIEALPESKLWEDFADPKYGSYYRNLHGIIEHFHYHLGQVVILKKLAREKS